MKTTFFQLVFAITLLSYEQAFSSQWAVNTGYTMHDGDIADYFDNGFSYGLEYEIAQQALADANIFTSLTTARFLSDDMRQSSRLQFISLGVEIDKLGIHWGWSALHLRAGLVWDYFRVSNDLGPSHSNHSQGGQIGGSTTAVWNFKWNEQLTVGLYSKLIITHPYTYHSKNITAGARFGFAL